MGEDGPGEKEASCTQRKHRPREGADWIHSRDRLGSPPSDPRGADLYELRVQCRELGQGLVIRAAQDRG